MSLLSEVMWSVCLTKLELDLFEIHSPVVITLIGMAVERPFAYQVWVPRQCEYDWASSVKILQLQFVLNQSLQVYRGTVLACAPSNQFQFANSSPRQHVLPFFSTSPHKIEHLYYMMALHCAEWYHRLLVSICQSLPIHTYDVWGLIGFPCWVKLSRRIHS